MPRKRRYLLGLSVLIAGAFAAILFAFLVLAFTCDEGGGDCSRTLAYVQLFVSLIGILPLARLWTSISEERNRGALLWLAVCVVTYGVWAILNDATVHGWDDLRLL
jgi:hypothetical protein